MKRFITWRRRDTRQNSVTCEADQRDVGVRPEQKTEGEHSDDSFFSWSWANQADTSVFDTGHLVTEKSENKNAVSHKTPDLEGDSACNAEEDIGVDPYNTGRFDTKKT
jgi:hypothetical protein